MRSLKAFAPCYLVFATSGFVLTTHAELPAVLHHQGRVTVNNVNFDGNGSFRFLLFTDSDSDHSSGNETAIWKIDDATPSDLNEPVTAVSLTVSQGLYSIRLGEAPQVALPTDLVPPPGESLFLRTWFDNGVNGSQQLSPDQQIASVAFALHSGTSGENLSDFTNDTGFISSIAGLNVSELTNDTGFLTAATLPPNIMLQGESVSLLANDAGYITSATLPGSLPSGVMLEGENVSLLANDANYLSGNGSISINGSISVGTSTVIGTNSVAFGDGTAVDGNYCFAWGGLSSAESLYATAFGGACTASNTGATAWGNLSEASGVVATAWGTGTLATRSGATAWGFQAEALGTHSTAWGDRTVAESEAETVLGRFDTDYAGDPTAWITTDRLFVIGNGDSDAARSDALVVLKSGDTTLNGDLTLNGSLNLSTSPITAGTLYVSDSISNGLTTTASPGQRAVAFGHSTEALGLNSVAWGFESNATTTSSTAWGSQTTASGVRSTAWGISSVSSGLQSTAWGRLSNAAGDSSTAFGENTAAESFAETVIGRYDTDYAPASTSAWNAADRLFVIGNGTGSAAKADALVMLKNGDTELNGELCVNDDVLVSGDFKYKTAKSCSLTVSPAAFRIDALAVTNYEPVDDYISPAASGTHQFAAQVNLPKGAVITEVRFYLDDEEGGAAWSNFDGWLRRRNQGSVGTTTMGTVSDPFAIDSNVQTITTIADATVVDTRQYTLLVQIDSNGSSNGTRFLGATVDYTIDSIQP
ncbi:hypothetical protein HAHE_40890 [Haloferula helveola]|uniref:Trimeric autotransporter adhesin YadA-like head domain-containing protein n=1 Tax=Haloferula helveola TaxID=490095 RepID=A0ABN6H974_9BACT|nr:hypothetical protein HAHE_40890 [Haloferula helveola]